MITTYLKENNLIICPNSLKKKIIEEINKNEQLISYKIMDLDSFMENYFFSYDKKTIFYLMKKLGLKYKIVLEYLESFYFIEDREYKTSKLNELRKLKNDVFEKKLLLINPNFNYYLNHTNVIVYGYNYLDPFYQKVFSKLSSYKHISVINEVVERDIYEFDDIEDEIAYVCHDIKNRIDQGVSINQIKIINPSSEYINPLKRIFGWCHIPIDLENKISIYDLEIGKKVLNDIIEGLSFSEIIDKYKENLSNTEVLNQIITIFNSYADFEEETMDFVSMIEYDFKHTFLPRKKKNNCVIICDFSEVCEDDYVYLLGFNKENYPLLYKDEDFLNDEMKRELDLFDSNQNNINNMAELKNNLNQKINLMITYKLKTAFNSYNPCLLTKEDNYSVIRDNKIPFNISHFYNQITLSKEYDNFYKYGTVSENLENLISSYNDLDYRSYDNSFKGINNPTLLASLKTPFNLSYSTIDEYYRCGFRYYVSNILKIKEENIDEFYMNIGNIFHYVLSQCFSDDFNFEIAWSKEASKYEFTFDKMILLEKLKQELKYDIEIINKHRNYSYLDQYLYEKRFSIPIKNDKNINVNFVGIVDKISYLKESNRTLVAVTDYKTGHLPSNLNNLIYGIGMQLPIYLYFIKRSSLFPNLEIVGFYLQKIINKDMKATTGKTIDELKENALKLVGYSTDNEDILEKFDMTYQDSQVISGLKKKKEGFYVYSKILNDKQMKKMDLLVEKKIEEGTNLILNGEFKINPKKIDRDIVGCEFCSYRDICFKTEKDYVELEKHKDLDFLGGDDNA